MIFPAARLFCTSMVRWFEEPLKRRVTSFDEDVGALQELHRFRHDFGKVAEKITVEEVAGEAPDGFLRVALLEARDEGEEAFLIGGLHGFAAQKGEAFVIFVSDLV